MRYICKMFIKPPVSAMCYYFIIVIITITTIIIISVHLAWAGLLIWNSILWLFYIKTIIFFIG